MEIESSCLKKHSVLNLTVKCCENSPTKQTRFHKNGATYQSNNFVFFVCNFLTTKAKRYNDLDTGLEGKI